jgi:uncharacterized protein DUF998
VVVCTGLWLAALVFLHLAPTGYSPLRNAVSEYGLGRFAWGYRAQVLFAAAAAAFLAASLPARPRPEIVLLAVFAAARVAIAFFPASAKQWEPALGFVAIAGAVGTSLAIRRVPELRPVLGLFERLFYAAIIAWFFVVAARI